jgi:predicted alpha/beta hydrolase family esterase
MAQAKKRVLFIQGGGEGGYEVDAKLAASLRAALGDDYDVRYPRLAVDEDAPDFGWPRQIEQEIAASDGGLILVGHSLGASVLLKLLSEHPVARSLRAIFLLSTPFWGGDEKWRYPPLALRDAFAERLPEDVPVFLYHCRDDEEVDVAHLALYAERLPRATVRLLPTGGHQLGEDLTPVAEQIRRLE